MKHRTYNPVSISLAMETDIIANITDTKIIDCPRCRYCIPIHEEVVNYKEMYEKQREYASSIYHDFCNFLDKMAKESPDSKIWMENNKQELIDQANKKIKEIKDNL